MEKKKSTRRCHYCFKYRTSHGVSSQIREKKINVTNRRSRRRTRSIGRSKKKKKTGVNHLEAKAASCRQELDAAGISLFQAFGWWSAARRKRAEKNQEEKGERERGGSLSPLSHPLVDFFLLTYPPDKSLCMGQ